MKLFSILFICLYNIACNSNSSHENLNRFDSCCLQYKGKALFKIGESIKYLDTSFSFRYDPNGDVTNQINYLSTDPYFTSQLNTGSMNGIIFFCANKNNVISQMEAVWIINIEMNETEANKAIDTLRKYYFPCLPMNFNRTKEFILSHEKYDETFNFFRTSDSSDIEHSFNPQFNFSYKIKLIKQ